MKLLLRTLFSFIIYLENYVSRILFSVYEWFCPLYWGKGHSRIQCFPFQVCVMHACMFYLSINFFKYRCSNLKKYHKIWSYVVKWPMTHRLCNPSSFCEFWDASGFIGNRKFRYQTELSVPHNLTQKHFVFFLLI